MKKIFIFFLSAVSVHGHAQVNLVPNSSFEQYSSCPGAGGEVFKATGWNSFNTADHFHVCATSSDIQVPQNVLGYQYPATGNGYCGFFAYYASADYHEFLYTQLLSPLIINQKYFISFKVSPADSTFCVYSNKTGVKFFTAPPGNISLNNTAHFYTNSIITDTSGWTKVSGSFIADSSYNYIALGNFFNDANTDTIVRICPFPFFLSYYYVDDICVSTDSLSCNLVLPVSLLSFNVEALKNTLQLNWRTAQENNNKGFEILRSEADANHFHKIGFVQGAVYSSVIKQYSFNDENLLKNKEYYYKLKQIDFDNKFSYSSIQKARIDDIRRPDFFINPNPVKDVLKIYFNQFIREKCTINIIDNSGKIIYTNLFSNILRSQSINIDMQSFASGLYFIQFIKNDIIRIEKVLKQ